MTHPLSAKDGKWFWRGFYKSPDSLKRMAAVFARSSAPHIRQYAKDIRAALKETA